MRNRGIELERGMEGKKRPAVVVPYRRCSPIDHRRRSPTVAVTLPARERASPATIPCLPSFPYWPGAGRRPPPHPYWPGGGRPPPHPYWPRRGHRPPPYRSPPNRRRSRVRGVAEDDRSRRGGRGLGEERIDGERTTQIGWLTEAGDAAATGNARIAGRRRRPNSRRPRILDV
jgi:hypothetical protein